MGGMSLIEKKQLLLCNSCIKYNNRYKLFPKGILGQVPKNECLRMLLANVINVTRKKDCAEKKPPFNQ